MGANVSTAKQETLQTLENSLTQHCTPTAGISQVKKNIKITLSGKARCPNMDFGQKSSVSSSCNMDTIAKQLAESATHLTKEQTAGLGVNISADQQSNEANIKTYLDLKCGSDAKIRQSMENIDFTIEDQASCDTLNFLQEATAGASCVMKAVTDQTDLITQSADIKQAGLNPLALLGAIGAVLLLVAIFPVLLMTGNIGKLIPMLPIIGLILIVVGIWWEATTEEDVPGEEDEEKKFGSNIGQILIGIGSVLFIGGISYYILPSVMSNETILGKVSPILVIVGLILFVFGIWWWYNTDEDEGESSVLGKVLFSFGLIMVVFGGGYLIFMNRGKIKENISKGTATLKTQFTNRGNALKAQFAKVKTSLKKPNKKQL